MNYNKNLPIPTKTQLADCLGFAAAILRSGWSVGNAARKPTGEKVDWFPAGTAPAVFASRVITEAKAGMIDLSIYGAIVAYSQAKGFDHDPVITFFAAVNDLDPTSKVGSNFNDLYPETTRTQVLMACDKAVSASLAAVFSYSTSQTVGTKGLMFTFSTGKCSEGVTIISQNDVTVGVNNAFGCSGDVPGNNGPSFWRRNWTAPFSTVPNRITVNGVAYEATDKIQTSVTSKATMPSGRKIDVQAPALTVIYRATKTVKAGLSSYSFQNIEVRLVNA